MEKPNDYDQAEAKKQGGDFPQPPVGGHILKVVKAEEGKSSKGRPMLTLFLDIAEGEFANHYTELSEKLDKDAYLRQYQLLDGDAVPYFKGMVELFEFCNQGFKFNFDEKTLVGKKIGANLREEEYRDKENNVKTGLKIGYFASIEEVRSGLEPMKKKTLKPTTQTAPVSTASVPDANDLPF